MVNRFPDSGTGPGAALLTAGNRRRSAATGSVVPFLESGTGPGAALLTAGNRRRSGATGSVVPFLERFSSLGFLAATFTSSMIAASPVMASPGTGTFYDSISSVPEPATFVLIGGGLLAVGMLR